MENKTLELVEATLHKEDLEQSRKEGIENKTLSVIEKSIKKI